ncbi:MAG: bifunctional glutamate N-acetyltransferase/amino-acid acetyltransferase ArgJ [Methanobacteriota archaeon]
MKLSDTERGVCIKGFKAFGLKEGKVGVAVIYSDRLCQTAGVFTKNSVKAAPVIVSGKNIKNGLQAIVANSGQANACVKNGVADALSMCKKTAETLGISPKNVGVASTGVIGKAVKIAEVEKLIEKTVGKLGCSKTKSLKAVKAIMTTDTKPKMCSAKYKDIEVGGIMKGSGMIAPNMATMLCFLTTNADIGADKMNDALANSVEKSFNRVVVDGDESTNDTVLLMSNMKEKCKLSDFVKMLDYVTESLAKQMAADGEGATKLIEFTVVHGRDEKSAKKIVNAVLSSPLVKTAVYGENPNWGRIIGKIGSVEKIDFEKIELEFSSGRKKAVALHFGGRGGDRKKVGEILKSSEIKIKVDLNSGKGSATGWGCDLSEKYVKINAEYN